MRSARAERIIVRVGRPNRTEVPTRGRDDIAAISSGGNRARLTGVIKRTTAAPGAVLSFSLACVACGPSGGAPPAGPSARDPSVDVAVSAALPARQGPPLVIADADRRCRVDADCTAILTGCGACGGDCTGVRVDAAETYDGALDCSTWGGVRCNYDCRPAVGIERPACVAGRCGSVKR